MDTTKTDRIARGLVRTIAQLRALIRSPIIIPLGGDVGLQLNPIDLDQRVDVVHTSRGGTTVNYTAEGLIVDVVAPSGEVVRTVSLDADDLIGGTPATRPFAEFTDEVVCEIAGIRLVQAEEPEVFGRWDWISPNGSASDMSFDTCAEAAEAAIEAHFPYSDWQREAGEGDTRLGYREWLVHQAQPFADEHPQGRR